MTRGTLKDEATAGSGQMAAYLNEKIQGRSAGSSSSYSRTDSQARRETQWRLPLLCDGGGNGNDLEW